MAPPRALSACTPPVTCLRASLGPSWSCGAPAELPLRLVEPAEALAVLAQRILGQGGGRWGPPAPKEAFARMASRASPMRESGSAQIHILTLRDSGDGCSPPGGLWLEGARGNPQPACAAVVCGANPVIHPRPASCSPGGGARLHCGLAAVAWRQSGRGDVSVEVCVGRFDHDVEPTLCWRRASRC